MVSFPTPNCPGVTQRSPKVVWLVLGPHHRDSHIQRSQCGGRAPKEGYGVPRVAMCVPRDTIDNPGVAIGVLKGWS